MKEAIDRIIAFYNYSYQIIKHVFSTEIKNEKKNINFSNNLQHKMSLQQGRENFPYKSSSTKRFFFFCLHPFSTFGKIFWQDERKCRITDIDKQLWVRTENCDSIYLL